MGNPEIPDETQVAEMVQSLADWLSKQPHLPRIQADKVLLGKFLVNCKYRVQKAKTKIDQYYSCRTAHPQVYLNRDPTSAAIQTISKLCPVFPLPRRTPRGELAIVARADPNIADIIPMDYLRYLTMVLDIVFLEEEAKLDFIVIIDYRGFSFAHFLKLTTIASVCTEILLEVYPGQFKGEHCVYVPSFIDSVVALFKRMVKPKLRDRIHVHKELDTFHDMVGKDFLPSDLGGSDKSIEELNDIYRKKVESYKDWLKSQEDVRSKEELRQAASKDSAFTGVEGSFRRLNVD
nr:PREDICTED: alpha-tocopherol transfer protein-like [Bemisia tabaci]